LPSVRQKANGSTGGGPNLPKAFQDKKNGCIKVVLKPSSENVQRGGIASNIKIQRAGCDANFAVSSSVFAGYR
jgi:hypothetical protein